MRSYNVVSSSLMFHYIAYISSYRFAVEIDNLFIYSNPSYALTHSYITNIRSYVKRIIATLRMKDCNGKQPSVDLQLVKILCSTYNIKLLLFYTYVNKNMDISVL